MAQSKANNKARRFAGTVGIVKPGFALPHNRLILPIAGVVILFALGGLAVWWWQRPEPSTVTVSMADVDTLQYEADTAANQSGVWAGLNIYKLAIPEAVDSVTRANLDMQASDLASNYNQLTTALTYALQADTILHTADTSSSVASIYVQEGNRTEAAAYYTKAAGEVKPHQLSGENSQYYLNAAKQAAVGVSQ